MVDREKTGARETIDSYKEKKNKPSYIPFKYEDIPKHASFFPPSEFVLHKDFCLFVTLHFNSSEFDRQPLLCVQKAS